MEPRGITPPSIRVLVADDHLVLRMGLESLINRQRDMTVVAEASSGPEAVEQYKTHRPDVTLMDLRMPGLTGVEAIAAICAINPAARVIVLTIHKGDEAVYQAVRAGARGYLIKDVPTEELLAAIRTVHQGQRCIPPDIAARMLERLWQADLTPREIDILRHVACGLGNKEIGDSLEISQATVKNHVASIIAKLGAEDRTHAVTLALERNIIDLEELRLRGRPTLHREVKETLVTSR
jgi:two-component system, NarL family, response regulator